MGLRRLSAGLLALILLTGCGKNTGSLLPQGGEAEVAAMYVARPVPAEYWLSPLLGLRLFRGDYCALVKTGVMVFPSYVQEACEINDGISLSSNHAVTGNIETPLPGLSS